jgi:hypothetical protein
VFLGGSLLIISAKIEEHSWRHQKEGECMSQFESQYDCIVIGTGKSGRASVEALKEKGLNPLYIHLTSEMMTMMVSQQMRQQNIQAGDPSSQTETSMSSNQDGPIFSHKQTLRTPIGEMTTYTFQVQPALWESGQENKTSSPETFTSIGQMPRGDEPEVLEAQQVEYVSHPFFSERGARRKKAFRRNKTKLSFQEQPEIEEEYPIYPLERIKLEDDETKELVTSGWKKNPFYDERSSHQGEYEQKEEEADDTETPPVYRERELKLRKRLTENHHVQGFSDSDREEQEQETTIPKNFDNGLFQDSSYFQEPLFKPFSYSPDRSQPNQSSRQPFESKHYEQSGYDQPYDQHPFTDPPSYDSDSYESSQSEPAKQENDIFPLEPFSARRRSRNQKKARLQSLAEQREKKQPKRPASIFWEEPQGEEEHSLFPNGHPTIQPFSRESEDDPETQEGESNLKRDDIEFEDAYGGYNSWEEFITPFSQNSRKRQEIDKIEKRKIALRGLHNLINNLG